tara:strand:- start:45 stop:251 length:207 start_codon:yes stop_codon:yes gene_type:complete
MKKCPKCGYSEKESFNDMMDRVIKEVSDRHRKEFGFGIPDKEEDKVYFNEPKKYKGELTNVKRDEKDD